MELLGNNPELRKIGHTVRYAMENKQLALLGVLPDGKMSEDHFIRGDHMPKDVTGDLDEYFKGIASRKNQFTQLPSLNDQITIYGPMKKTGSDALLEWTIFSGLVDLLTGIRDLHPKVPSFDTEFTQIREALNGKNTWNLVNLVIDFKNDFLICRSMARLSSESYSSLAQDPFLTLIQKYNWFPVDEKTALRMQQFRDADTTSAKEIALAYLKKTFFP